jgi:hypothetical protein
LREAEALGNTVGESLRLVADPDHRAAREADCRGILGRQEQHRRRRSRIEFALVLARKQVAHRHRHVAEIDVDRAWVGALMAHGAVVGDIAELIEVAQ